MSKTNNTAKALNDLTNLFQYAQKGIENIVKTINPEDKMIEVVEPFYVNPVFVDKFKIPTIYRFNQHNNRHYFTVADFNPEEPIIPSKIITFFPSVTNIEDKTMPMSFGKQQIIGDLGLKGYHKMMREKAFYGTFIHILIADYLRSANHRNERWFDFDSIPGRVSLYTEEHNIDFETKDWIYNSKKDLASLMQFCIEYEVEPYAVEIIGTYNDGKYRFAGTLDLLCELTVSEKGFFGDAYASGPRKGEPKETKQGKRVKALVDFKSGKSGFFTDYEVQLHMYNLIVEQSFGMKVEKLYNVAPYDWEREPTYSVKDQTESIQQFRIPHILGSYQVEWKDPKEILFISGKLNGAGMNDVVKWVPAADYVFNYVRKNFYQDK